MMLFGTMAASQEVGECIENFQYLIQQFEQLYSLKISKYLPVKLY